MPGPLLVIIPDRLSDLVTKGEISPRYYNPGQLFEQVHLVLSNDDHPSAAELEYLTGTTDVHVHNLPAGRATAALAAAHPRLARWWTAQVVEVAAQVRPALVRCYAPYLNAIGAAAVHRALGVPYVVSIHGLPDPVAFGAETSLRGRVAGLVQQRLARRALADADAVVAVYEALLPWLASLPGPVAEVAYNVVCPDLERPTGPAARRGARLRVLCVGRQIPGKDPRALIAAAAEVEEVDLTVIGDGPLHEGLRTLVASLGVDDRVRLQRSIRNGDLCGALADYDVFALHNDYPGISKTALEAMLAGLPVVANRSTRLPDPELQGDGVVVVDDSVAGYRAAFQQLLDDDVRSGIAASALDRAWSTWSPIGSEERYVQIYQRLLASRP